MYTLGIDIGSTTSKAVILKDGSEIVASSIVVATVGTDGVSKALENVMKESGLTHVPWRPDTDARPMTGQIIRSVS